ncbi:MAG: hypothetical protein J3K34DRAFT_420013 [Monoraphidium minutum]|nr:MAG: hypothetical protein J3K34DRAFT_420013 [Monoraphidium minutum]
MEMNHGTTGHEWCTTDAICCSSSSSAMDHCISSRSRYSRNRLSLSSAIASCASSAASLAASPAPPLAAAGEPWSAAIAAASAACAARRRAMSRANAASNVSSAAPRPAAWSSLSSSHAATRCHRSNVGSGSTRSPVACAGGGQGRRSARQAGFAPPARARAAPHRWPQPGEAPPRGGRRQSK